MGAFRSAAAAVNSMFTAPRGPAQNRREAAASALGRRRIGTGDLDVKSGLVVVERFAHL
jgi:hypothetical protein